MKSVSRINSLIIITAGFSVLNFFMEHRSRKVDDVIARSQIILSPADRQKFLDSKAEKFLLEKDYRNAKEVAEYIIYNLNGESQTANDILQRYREKLDEGS